MRSVARRVASAGVAVLLGSLALVGVITGGALHLRAVAARDDALIAAAHARARPAAAEPWRVYQDPPDIRSWVVGQGDDIVPPRIHARVLRDGRPLLKDMGDERLLLVPAEAGGELVVVAALGPRVTFTRSVGPFVAVWLVTSAAVSLLAVGVLSAAVRRSLRSLDEAREDVTRVVGLGQGLRVSVAAPEEIRPLLAAVNDLLDRLDSAHSLQATFTAEAAHELRTPVATLLSQLEVALLDDAGDPRRALDSLREDVLRLGRIVAGLTALARVDAGDIEADRSLVRAGDVAGAALDMERVELERAGCDVTLHLDEDPELEVHQALLELALANLLRNAARHAPGSAVVLTVRTGGDHVVFEVRDAGPGIDDARSEALFTRFARAGSARAGDPGGLGLGLPLAREVGRRHGGDCTLHGVVDGGTRAVLTARLATA